MSKTTKDIKVPYPNEGTIRSAQLSDPVSPENSTQLGLNGNFDRIGSWMTRKGITAYATALAGAIITFGSLSIQSSGLRRLIAQVANTIFSWDGASWTNTRTLGNSVKARYTQFLNLTYMCNGNALVAGSDPVQTFGGTTWGSTNVSFFPKVDYIQAGFEGRVWGLDKALDRLYYSNIVTPTGVITTANPCDYIEKLSPQDGESFTGVVRVSKALLIFKQNHIYRVYGASSVDPYPAYYVGTYSQESIVTAKDGIYFHHSSGFYKFNYDTQPIEISRRVKDFVDAIPRTSYEDVVGLYDGRDNVEWAVGPVTVEGVTYQNCIMRYTISTQVWTIYDVVAGERVRAMILYDDGTLILPLVGTTTGKTGRLEDGQTDFGQPIYFEYIDRWRSFTDMWSHAKALAGMAVHTENGAGAMVQFQTDKDAPNEWRDVGKIEASYMTLFPNMSTDDFNRFRYRIKGFTTGPQMIFNGVEFLSLQDKGYDEN